MTRCSASGRRFVFLQRCPPPRAHRPRLYISCSRGAPTARLHPYPYPRTLTLALALTLARSATALRQQYGSILDKFGKRKVGPAALAAATGSFSFVEPLAILSVLARNERAHLALGELCVVDIGGGGHTPDFLRPFLGTSRYVAFDATPRSIRENQLTFAHKHDGYTMLNQIVTPPSLAAMLAEQNIPKRLAVLKIDIDSCDCDVLAAAFAAGFEPSVVVIETNPAFPPPIRFNLAYKPNMHHNDRGAGSPIFGCSLAYATDLAERHGYALLQAPIEDAYFVPRTTLRLFGELPRDPAVIYAMGNPLQYAYRDFGPGTLSEWARWPAAELGRLLRLVQSNVTSKISVKGLSHLDAQVQLSLAPIS